LVTADLQGYFGDFIALQVAAGAEPAESRVISRMARRTLGLTRHDQLLFLLHVPLRELGCEIKEFLFFDYVSFNDQRAVVAERRHRRASHSWSCNLSPAGLLATVVQVCGTPYYCSTCTLKFLLQRHD
jgi:hypothetical protein